MNEIRVGIVDDHAVVRQGLAVLLDRQPGMRVVGDAASASAALAMVAQARPHVLLLDLKLSADRDGDGLRVCAAVTERFPQSRVLVLTTFADEWMILEAIKQGAHGYLLKDVEISELVRAIRAVRRGESTLDPRSASAVVQWMQGSRAHGGGGPASTARSRRRAGAPVQQITPREREILALLARGMSNGAIGQRLYISSTTVKFHVGNVLRKLGASRRAEAVYAASKMGLI